MADSDWTGYVGMATGIFGAVMGYLGYQRSNQIKKLDLRLELRKGLGDAHLSLSTLRAAMEIASSSHAATLAARGLGGSGVMVAWTRMKDEDQAEVDKIAASVRAEDADFGPLSAEQLETAIVATHKIKNRLSELVNKYRGELAADDESRRQIAQEVTAAIAATRTRPRH